MLIPNTPRWKMVLIILLILMFILVNAWFMRSAYADESCWILCQPDSWVNVRMNPKKKSMEIGRLECGDEISTDGVIKNGFLHVYVSFELCEGWIHKGYVVYDKPTIPLIVNTTIKSNGRVAARKTINGQRRCWLKDGQSIKVYMISEEWSVTNKGFVKTKFIETGK